MELVAGAATTHRRAPTIAWPVAAAAGYLVAFTLWQLVGREHGDTARWISDIAPIPAEIAAVAVTWWASMRAPTTRLRVAWRLVSAAYASFLVGDVVWLLYEMVLGKPPFPSPADGFYLGFYAVLVAGLLAFPVARRSGFERATLMFDFGAVLVAASIVVWYLVIGPTVTEPLDEPMKVALSLLYPVADLVVLFGLLAVLARGVASTPRRAVACLLVGVTCYLVADVAFASLTLENGYRAGDWPDTLWLAASLLVVIAAWPGPQATPPPSTAEDAREPTYRAVLPFLMIAFVWGTVMLAARNEPMFPIYGLLIGGFVLTLLVLGRHLTSQREIQSLLRRYHDIASADALTQVASRHRFFDEGTRRARAAYDRGETVSVLMIDVDGLKVINDEWGHTAGDDALRAIAAALRHQLGPRTLIGRFGGDEFVALLTGRPGDEVAATCTAISNLPIPLMTRQGPSTVKVTAGAATAPSPDVDALIAAADAALYERRAHQRSGRRGRAVRTTPRASTPSTSA